MFHGLSSDVEESFFADNINAFIPIAPCMIVPNRQYDDYPREDVIDTWLNHTPALSFEFPVSNMPENNEAYCSIAPVDDCSMVYGMQMMGMGWADAKSVD